MKNLFKRLRSKTYWYGLGITVVGFLDQYTTAISDLIPDGYKGVAVAVLGIGVLILREMTKSPVADK